MGMRAVLDKNVAVVGKKPFISGPISSPAGSVDIMGVFMRRLLGNLSKLADWVSWHNSQLLC